MTYLKKVNKVAFNNIPEHFTLPGAELAVPTETGELKGFESEVTFAEGEYEPVTVYIPEFLRSKSTDTDAATAPHLVISGEGFTDQTVSLAIHPDEVWMKLEEMAIPLNRTALDNSSVVRNMEYNVSITLEDTQVRVRLAYKVEGFESEEIEITDHSYSGIVNVDRRDIRLGGGNTGTLYFSFKNHDTDASEYMAYLKSTVTADPDGIDFGPIPRLVGSMEDIYLLDFNSQYPFPNDAIAQGHFYLHFKNKYSSGESDIIIKIGLI